LAAVPSIGRASLVEAPNVAPQAAATQGLYERHAAKIQSYCMHQLGSREEAEDAVQTTFMNAFRALGRGVVPEAESAWLFKIAENVCLSRRRSSWRRGRIESPSDFEVIEEIVPGPSRQRDELIGIEDALASMPEQQRRAILLREWQGLSYREIAAELEVSQSAVETLIFRARRSLAQGLEQPDSIKPAKRTSFRRALHMIDLGTIAAALKTLLAGSAAVKATAAAVAVTAAVGTVATVTPTQDSRTPDAPAPVTAKVTDSPLSVAPAAGTGGPAAGLSTPTAPAAEQKPAGANASRTPPARVLPAIVAAVAPVDGPAHAPQAAPKPASPAADEPKQEEPKYEVTPATEQSGGTGETKNEGKSDEGGKQGRGAQATPAPAEPAAAAPESSSPKQAGNAKGRSDMGDNPVVAPVSAPVAEAKNHDVKKDRGRGNDKRELMSVATSAIAPDAVVEASEPASEPAVDAAPASEPQPAEVVDSSGKSSNDKRDGDGNGKGK
jgi:RNA polymerase sigma factor (sigma-70 family)